MDKGSLMEWIARILALDLSRDKEWMLLAAGAALLVAVLAFVREIARSSSARKAPQHDSCSAPQEELPREYYESPTASEILATIDHAKPELKDGVRKSYIGRCVRWAVRLSSMCKMPSGNEACSTYTMFMLSGTQLKAVSVCFDIDIDAHPFLKTARVNQAFTVEGIIKDFPLADVVRLKDIQTVQRAVSERSVNPSAA
jgi:hypothetical protein